ncbi:MAG: metallophosphoesterase family protein [Gemmatimonadota bacterium]
MKVGLISDTHGMLRPEVFGALDGVDLILHAGDVGRHDIIVGLEAIAPVHAVLGNTDRPALLPHVPDELTLELEGSRVVLVHGHRLGAPTAARLRASYPAADVVVYGHTHRQRVDELDGCLFVNPGAAGAARFHLRPAVAVLELRRGSKPVVRQIVL